LGSSKQEHVKPHLASDTSPVTAGAVRVALPPHPLHDVDQGEGGAMGSEMGLESSGEEVADAGIVRKGTGQEDRKDEGTVCVARGKVLQLESKGLD
jgi:hypothetical protein